MLEHLLVLWIVQVLSNNQGNIFFASCLLLFTSWYHKGTLHQEGAFLKSLLTFVDLLFLFVYSLHMSAAAASRDVTLFHAHNLLHKHDYNISDALKALVPTTGKIASQQKKRKTREIPSK